MHKNHNIILLLYICSLNKDIQVTVIITSNSIVNKVIRAIIEWNQLTCLMSHYLHAFKQTQKINCLYLLWKDNWTLENSRVIEATRISRLIRTHLTFWSCDKDFSSDISCRLQLVHLSSINYSHIWTTLLIYHTR